MKNIASAFSGACLAVLLSATCFGAPPDSDSGFNARPLAQQTNPASVWLLAQRTNSASPGPGPDDDRHIQLDASGQDSQTTPRKCVGQLKSGKPVWCWYDPSQRIGTSCECKMKGKVQ